MYSMSGGSLCTRRVPQGVPQGLVWAQSSSLLQSTTLLDSSMGILCSLRTTQLCLAKGRLQPHLAFQ